MNHVPTIAIAPSTHPARRVRRFQIAAGVAGIALLSACAGPTNHYYTLAEAAPAPMAQQAPQDQAPLSIDFAPVGIAERLARPQMLVRKARTPSAEVQLMEFHRWSSSFEYELRDALASGVAARLGAVDSTRALRTVRQSAWRVAVQVRQFDLIQDDQVEAALGWTLLPPGSEPDTPGVTCQWTGRELAGSGTEALAQAAQRLTARVADAIASDLVAVGRGLPCVQP